MISHNYVTYKTSFQIVDKLRDFVVYRGRKCQTKSFQEQGWLRVGKNHKQQTLGSG